MSFPLSWNTLPNTANRSQYTPSLCFLPTTSLTSSSSVCTWSPSSVFQVRVLPSSWPLHNVDQQPTLSVSLPCILYISCILYICFYSIPLQATNFYICHSRLTSITTLKSQLRNTIKASFSFISHSVYVGFLSSKHWFISFESDSFHPLVAPSSTKGF